jgi:hypothetical protein
MHCNRSVIEICQVESCHGGTQTARKFNDLSLLSNAKRSHEGHLNSQ